MFWWGCNSFILFPFPILILFLSYFNLFSNFVYLKWDWMSNFYWRFYFKNYVHDLLRYQLNQSKHFLLFHLRFICRIDLQSYAADTRKEMDKIIFWHNREPQNYLDKGLYGILVIDWLDKYFFKSGPLEITFVIFFIPFVLLIDYTPGCFSVFFY